MARPPRRKVVRKVDYAVKLSSDVMKVWLREREVLRACGQKQLELIKPPSNMYRALKTSSAAGCAASSASPSSKPSIRSSHARRCKCVKKAPGAR